MGPPVSLLNKQIEAGAEERWVVNIFILILYYILEYTSFFYTKQ